MITTEEGKLICDKHIEVLNSMFNSQRRGNKSKIVFNYSKQTYLTNDNVLTTSFRFYYTKNDSENVILTQLTWGQLIASGATIELGYWEFYKGMVAYMLTQDIECITLDGVNKVVKSYNTLYNE